MKKWLIAAGVSFLLFSCGKAAPVADSKTENAEEPAASAAHAEQETDWFSGSYALSVQGKKKDAGIILDFTDASSNVTVHDIQNTWEADLGVTFGNLYPSGPDGIRQMTFTLNGRKGIEKEGTDYPEDFMVLSCRVNQEDVIALRFLGNGDSWLAEEVFQTENLTPSGYHVFHRPASGFHQEGNVKKNETFYAFCWYRQPESILIQPAAFEEEKTDWYGEERTLLRLYPESSAAVLLPVDETIQWRIFETAEAAQADRTEPVVMRLTTDGDGKAVKLFRMPYLGYGYYEAAEGSMIDYSSLLPQDPDHPVSVHYPEDYLTHEDDLVNVSVPGHENGAEVIFFTGRRVKDFRIHDLGFQSMEDDMPHFTMTELYHQETFLPEHPIDVRLLFEGSIPNCGISYSVDGETKYYALSMSGKDGSLFLTPFIPEAQRTFERS